ncbi:IclR family transcriptional regulator [Priestia megaterium]|jgi:IclR family transcriptional regulator, acetate operon repressor|uniref:IclR family transcriptional regulator n=1 Tax=Priestia megaterium TaxID=1404 RepID=A0A6H1P6R7_PRIMG|nr:IclR family transcriptional regulator [Priestia megaterium]QIZ09097.1 IclR family transcriptional regulator [Priestia megaterium]
MTIETKGTGIQSLQIALNILEILAMDKEPLKFTDIQNRTSMTKGNLYKYLATLYQFGLINRNPHTNTYTLGHKLVQLGNIALGQTSLIEVVIPYFKKITEHTSLTVLLAVPSIKGPLISYILSADYGINIGAQMGTHLPLSSSTGVVFSAFEKDVLMKEWEEEELSRLNESELQQYLGEKEKTRELFFVSKTEPLINHVSSFSVPLLNFNNELLGAITIVGITETVPKSADHPIGQYVLKTAKEISEYYGFIK